MYHSPFVQPPLTNVGSSFERIPGIFQDGRFIFRQPGSQGLSCTTWGGKGLGNKVDFQALFIIQDYPKFPTLGICVQSKPHPVDRPHSQSPMGSPTPTPWGLTLIGALSALPCQKLLLHFQYEKSYPYFLLLSKFMIFVSLQVTLNTRS